jgi:hypothetical protein
MKLVIYAVLGLAALTGVAFAAFWIWGTLAFTPERMPVALEAQGELGGGARYEIERSSRGFTTQHRSVQVYPRVIAVYVEGDRPRPIGARAVEGALEVDFADGAASVRVPIDADGAPLEYVSYDRNGAMTRAPQNIPSDESL